MKKTLLITLSVLVIILQSCAGSSGSGSEKTRQEEVSVQTRITESAEQTVSTAAQTEDGYEPLVLELPGNLYTAEEKGVFEVKDGFDILRNSLPKMDGSTSLIPFEAALRSALFGISASEARNDVHHSTTWGALENLLGGNSEAIFTCPLSDEQIESVERYEEQKGVKLKQIPVAMEAFVFVVNADNPVTTLTQQQIRDIYSGKITNWKEVGGRDAKIIAYQRNNDSGSQNYMLEFMQGYELTDAPVQFRAGSMKAAMDAMAYNDNAVDSIGYSVYAYAADMYENNELIRFIAVDGVAPNRTTIDDRSYPLLGYNYLMYFDSGDERLALLEKFALSDAVQLEAAKSGYVPILDVSFDFEAMLPEMYAGFGAGAEKSNEKIAYEYVSGVSENYMYDLDIGFIKDAGLKEEIKTFAESALKKQALLPSKNAPEYTILEKNGYVSMTVFTRYDTWADNDCYDYDGCKYVDCAIWDLKTQKRLSDEECFCRSTDIAAVLNTAVGTQLMHASSDWGNSYPTITDFKGLTKDGWWTFDLENVYLDGRNPYVETGVNISLDAVDKHLLVWSYERDDTEWVYKQFSSRNVVLTESGVIYSALSKNGYAFPLLVEDRFENGKKINEQIVDYMTGHFPLKDGEESDAFHNWSGLILAERFFILCPPPILEEFLSPEVDPEYARVLVFDLDSGDRTHLDDLLPESERGKIIPEDLKDIWIYSDNGFLVFRYVYADRVDKTLTVPAGSLVL